MSLPKLIKITQALDPKQCSDLKKFVLYYIGQDSDLFQILEAIIKQQSKMKDGEDVDAFAKKHFPNCTKKTFMNYLSQLYGYTEDWIAHHQLQENEYQKDLLVQQWLNKNGLYDVSDQLVSKARRKIKEVEKIDLVSSKVMAELLFEHFFSNNPVKYESKFAEFEEMVDAFITYTISMNILFLSELTSWENIFNKDQTNLKKKINSQINWELGTAQLMIMKSLFKMMHEDDLTSLFHISDHLLKNNFNVDSKLHFIIAYNTIIKSLNLYTKRIHNDRTLIVKLTEYGLNSGVYLKNGKLSTATFHNIVLKLLLTSTYEEIVVFIDKWISKVFTNNVEGTRALAMAQVCLYFHKFEEIDVYTRRYEFDNFNQKNLAQGLYLIGTFMNKKMDNDKYQNALISSMSFIKRNRTKMSSYLFNCYMNFFKVLKLIEQKNYNKLENLDDFNPLLHRTWVEYIINNKVG